MLHTGSCVKLAVQSYLCKLNCTKGIQPPKPVPLLSTWIAKNVVLLPSIFCASSILEEPRYCEE